MIEENGIETLVGLGLTTSQARVYITLLEVEKATGKMISKCSKVARQEVYRILAELNEKGLIVKILSSPTQFRPVSLEDCVDILVERKKNEISDAQKKATELLEKYNEEDSIAVLQQEEPELILIPEKGNFFRVAKRMVEDSQSSINVVTSLARFHYFMSLYHKEVKKALKRGVGIRVILEKNEDAKISPDIAKILEQNSNFGVKYTPNEHYTKFLAADNKKVLIVMSSKKDFAESPTLWANNQNIANIVNSTFEGLWSLSEKAIQTP